MHGIDIKRMDGHYYPSARSVWDFRESSLVINNLNPKFLHNIWDREVGKAVCPPTKQPLISLQTYQKTFHSLLQNASIIQGASWKKGEAKTCRRILVKHPGLQESCSEPIFMGNFWGRQLWIEAIHSSQEKNQFITFYHFNRIYNLVTIIHLDVGGILSRNSLLEEKSEFVFVLSEPRQWRP